MAVELEKIASLLEEAYESISALEQQNENLESENKELGSQMELQKQASAQGTWDSDDDMGSAVEYTSPEFASSEDKLDNFLTD